MTASLRRLAGLTLCIAFISATARGAQDAPPTTRPTSRAQPTTRPGHVMELIRAMGSADRKKGEAAKKELGEMDEAAVVASIDDLIAGLDDSARMRWPRSASLGFFRC